MPPVPTVYVNVIVLAVDWETTLDVGVVSVPEPSAASGAIATACPMLTAADAFVPVRVPVAPVATKASSPRPLDVRLAAPLLVEDVSQSSFVSPVQLSLTFAVPVAAPTKVSSRVFATVVVTLGAVAVTLEAFAWPLLMLIGFAWLAASM